MAKLDAEITVKGIKEVKNICELLNKYCNELPKELQEALIDIEKYGISEINRDYLENKYHLNLNNMKIESSFYDFGSLISVNKVLKRIVIFKSEKEITEYPEHFWLKVNDDMIVEW